MPSHIVTFAHNNRLLTVEIKKYSLSRKVKLKVDYKQQRGILTIPPQLSYKHATTTITSKHLAWLAHHLDAYEPIVLTKLNSFTLLGVPCKITACQGQQADSNGASTLLRKIDPSAQPQTAKPQLTPREINKVVHQLCKKALAQVRVVKAELFSRPDCSDFRSAHGISGPVALRGNNSVDLTQREQSSLPAEIHTQNIEPLYWLELPPQNNYLSTEPNAPLLKLFRQAVKTYAEEVSQHYLHQLHELGHKVKYNKLRVSEPKTRWGSCSSLGNIGLNWRLIFAPREIIDYVIAHELTHLVYFNHSHNFWELLKHSFPEVGAAKKWLKLNGASLHKIVLR